MVEIELIGMDSILSKVQQMGKAAKDIEVKAIEEAGKVILDAAKDNLKSQVKTRTGNLEEGLKMSPIKGSVGRRYILIGIQKDDNSDIFYGKFFEWGASAHRIKIRNGKYKGRVINHSGISPRPFLGPAYASKIREAMEIMKRELKQGLGLK